MASNPIHEETESPCLVSPDGWMTKCPGLFHFLTDSAAPRPYAYADQIGADLRYWRRFATFYVWFVALGLAMLVAGAWPLAPLFPLFIVAHYVFLLSMAVRGMRNCRVAQVTIDSYSLHPLSTHELFKEVRAAETTGPDGESIKVSFDMKEMRDLLDEGRALEVLIQFSKRSQYHSVVAYRLADPDECAVEAESGHD